MYSIVAPGLTFEPNPNLGVESKQTLPILFNCISSSTSSLSSSGSI